MTRGHFLFLPFLVLFFGFFHFPATSKPFGRSHLHVVGSSAVYSFAVAVADHHFHNGGVSAIIESTGTGGGIRLFCRGVGAETPDGVLTSRPFTPEETAYCHKNGAGSLVQLTLGYDGLVLGVSKMDASDRGFPPLSLDILRRAMSGSAATWHDLDNKFPSWPLKILGPSGNSGTKEAFLQLVMTDPKTGKIYPIQKDGRYIDASDQETVVVHKLMLEPTAIALFSYAFLTTNRDRIRAVAINDILPTANTIQRKIYPLSRPFYLVIKSNHINQMPGLYDFVAAFLSEESLGANGYLKRYGLVPLPYLDRMDQRRRLASSLGVETRFPTAIP